MALPLVDNTYFGVLVPRPIKDDMAGAENSLFSSVKSEEDPRKSTRRIAIFGPALFFILTSDTFCLQCSKLISFRRWQDKSQQFSNRETAEAARQVKQQAREDDRNL
jgi:hypothetical protein